MIERVLWGLLALLHGVPALATVRPALITRLYGVEPGGDTFALLHHRAALFAVVLVVSIWAIFDPAVRRLASVAVALSMLSFLAIYFTAGAPSSLRSIAVADMIGLPVLLSATWLAWRVA